MELKTYYFDTYAFFEVISGNPAYEAFKKNISIVTTRFNLMELYYGLLLKYGQTIAENYYKKFKGMCIEVDDETLKEAMIFRARNRKSKRSYVDCIGYTIALKKRITFLTGDNGFRNISNVEFVK